MERPITGFGHVGLTVTDIQRSIQWYEQILGFTSLWGFEKDGYKKHLLKDPSSGIVVSLTEHDAKPTGDRFEEVRAGLDHLAFQVPGMEHLEPWHAWLTEHGVTVSEIHPTTTGGMLMFRDPDNIQLEIYARRDATTSDEEFAQRREQA